jgi:hypothetical protein
VDKYDLVIDLKPGGIFLLNFAGGIDELNAVLPSSRKGPLRRRTRSFM